MDQKYILEKRIRKPKIWMVMLSSDVRVEKTRRAKLHSTHGDFMAHPLERTSKKQFNICV